MQAIEFEAESYDGIIKIPEIHKNWHSRKIKVILLHNHSVICKQNSIDFLLSVAGMFDSGINETSENVSGIISDLILNKYGEIPNDRTD